MKGDYLTDSDYALWNEPALNISEQDIIEELETFSHRIQRRNKGRKTMFTVVAALGALVSLTLGVGAGGYLASDMTERIAWSEVCVKKGAQQELLLPDGSKVILAPGSRLLYPERFAGKERHVYMDGEILFDVVTDQDCPFKVSANSTEISVSGTIFNVKAYHLDEAQTISLMEGSKVVRYQSISAQETCRCLICRKVNIRHGIRASTTPTMSLCHKLRSILKEYSM